MTDPKFTKGPWFATANGGDDPDSRALLVGTNDQYGDFTLIADCRSKWLEDEVGGTEEANAHLIAAAPEMYQALVEAHELIRGDKVGKEWKRACADFLKTSKAAIAKAEGGEA